MLSGVRSLGIFNVAVEHGVGKRNQPTNHRDELYSPAEDKPMCLSFPPPLPTLSNVTATKLKCL